MTRRGSYLRRTAYAASSLAMLIPLSGCGGDDPETTRAPQETSATPSVSPSADPSGAEPSGEETSGPPEPAPGDDGPAAVTAEEFAAVVDSALDPTAGADITIDSGLGFLSGEGSIDFRETPASLALTLTSSETGDGQQIETRIVGDVMYLQDGDRFLAIEVDSPNNPFGASLSDQLDPRKMLDEVEASFRSARDRGTVEQEGEELSAYRAVADGPALLDAVAPELADQPDTFVPDTVTCDLSVDDEGRARGIVIDLGGENGMLRYAFDSWRADVSIPTPPPGRVDDLTLPG